MSDPAAARTVDCAHVIRRVWDWLDQELDEPGLTAIREHLAICAGCRGHVEFAKSFLDRVHEPPRTDAELSALRNRVRKALRP